MTIQGYTLDIIQGDTYSSAADHRPLAFQPIGTWPDLTGASITFKVFERKVTPVVTILELDCVNTDGVVTCSLESEDTTLLRPSSNKYSYRVVAELKTGPVVTLSLGILNVTGQS